MLAAVLVDIPALANTAWVAALFSVTYWFIVTSVSWASDGVLFIEGTRAACKKLPSGRYVGFDLSKVAACSIVRAPRARLFAVQLITTNPADGVVTQWASLEKLRLLVAHLPSSVVFSMDGWTSEERYRFCCVISIARSTPPETWSLRGKKKIAEFDRYCAEVDLNPSNVTVLDAHEVIRLRDEGQLASSHPGASTMPAPGAAPELMTAQPAASSVPGTPPAEVPAPAPGAAAPQPAWQANDAVITKDRRRQFVARFVSAIAVGVVLLVARDWASVDRPPASPWISLPAWSTIAETLAPSELAKIKPAVAEELSGLGLVMTADELSCSGIMRSGITQDRMFCSVGIVGASRRATLTVTLDSDLRVSEAWLHSTTVVLKPEAVSTALVAQGYAPLDSCDGASIVIVDGRSPTTCSLQDGSSVTAMTGLDDQLIFSRP
jgi:hypothetical protein